MANILGLNFGHDGSVCLVKDGKLVSAVSTERITGVKKQPTFTDDVINYVLDSGGLTIDDIDIAATNDVNQQIFGNEHEITEIEIQGRKIKTYVISHHLAHCASVFYTSPFDKAHCFSMDCSMGKPQANSLVAYGNGNKLICQYCPGEMVGVLYGEVTEKLGLGSALHKAGTTMGLASYGEPFDFDYKSYQDDIKHKMNVAASVQDLFENKVLNVLNDIDRKSDNLCLSGGSFLNCNANSRVVKETTFKNVHHFPACGDDGTSVGSALYVSHHFLNEPRHTYETQELCYTGRDYQSQPFDYDYIASELSKGKIIGLFQGRSEFGPRALGNRSILADPRNFHNRELINHVVKNREWFRPFAPVVLEECYQDWFDFPVPSPYMLYTAQVKQPDKIPAVTHVDGSARFQTVTEQSNRDYYNIIKSFGNLTGVPVLLNTSLNGNGMPILETEEDAKNFFKESNLDMMIVNGIVYK